MPQQHKKIPIRSDCDVILARTMSRELAILLGFGLIDQARIATTVSELARNIVLYAGTGQVIVRSLERDDEVGIEIECKDQGPGIANIAHALGDEITDITYMGRGLAGARRLMDEFDLQSQPGVGTTIICRKWHA